MSRLVDADTLRERIEDHVTSVSVCCTSQEAYGRIRMKMLALQDVDEAPTVDAIPVKWMVSWINRHPNDLRCAWFASIEIEWRKEQEAR